MAATNCDSQTIAQLFEAVASGQLQQQWENQLNNLEDVDSPYSEGRTLLQEAVRHGRLDWVKALLVKVADPEVSRHSPSALEVAKQMADQHPENADRQFIYMMMNMLTSRQRNQVDIRSQRQQQADIHREEPRPMTSEDAAVSEGEVSTLNPTDLPSLEKELGVTLSNCGRKVLLPHDRWQLLQSTVGEDGSSLLMQAARGGARECVDLLLRCGCDVNASRVSGREERRAIDFAVEGGHLKVVLLLLQWDSALPTVSTIQIERDDDIHKFLREREEFHRSIKDGHITKVETILNDKRDILGDANHWSDKNGRSALYQAVYSENLDVWALLKSNKFECLESEAEKMKAILKCERNGKKLNRAMGNYFRDVEDSHVYKIMSRTRVLGEVKEPRWTIENIYKEASKVPQANLLLQCLQDELHLEVVFDMQRSDISGVYFGCPPKVLGILDPQLDRVYVSASLDSLSETISNIVHELAHKVMHVLFGNRGLPYKKDDLERMKAYGKIAETILYNPGILGGCNQIIKRVVECYGVNHHLQELIVRIPEIMTKHRIENGNNESDPWLNEHERKLYEYYCIHIEPEIEKQIKTNYARRRMPNCDVLSYPALLSNHVSDDIQVSLTEKPTRGNHHGVGFLQVSNLKLGLNHLKKSFKNLIYVDWTKFPSLKTILEIQLRRGIFSNLAVVWDEKMERAFCTEPDECVESCPAKQFLDLEEYITIVVPRNFTVSQDIEPVEYGWGDLSENTKTWLWNTSVNFQGSEVTLRKLKESVVDGDDSTMNTFLDADVISHLIDGQTFVIGRNIGEKLAERRRQMLRDQPATFIERRTKVRPVDFDETLNEQGTSDAVFIFNANEEDLKKANVPNFRKWDGEDTPEGVRFFFFELHAEGGDDEFREICDKLKSSNEINWRLAHLFRFEENKFLHVYSQSINVDRCQLLADVPGSGKSLFANSAAIQEKKTHPERWVELLELTEHQHVISKWNENDSNVSNLESFLFHLIGGSSKMSRTGESSFEEKVFKKFCQAIGKLSLYLDGFDEICPDHKEKCSSLLEALLNKTSAKVFVTTRTHECFHLEKQMSVFAVNLVPFDKKDQVGFMNAEWNGLLRSLCKLERDNKIKAIVFNVKARRQTEEIVNLVKNLEKLLPMESIPENIKIKFDWLAEELINIEKPKAGNEGSVSDIPLHTWMMAFICFGDNFIPSESQRLSRLYERFIELKIEAFNFEKAKLHMSPAGKNMNERYSGSIRQLLKGFAAFIFLEKDFGCNPSKSEIEEMLRVGLVIKRENYPVFIHRTFGEHLFSVWLLEESADKEVTKVFLSRVLLEIQFENVRKIMDEILLSQNEYRSLQNEENIGYKNILPSTAAFPNDLVQVIKNSFYISMEECHAGILQYLVDFSGNYLADVLFGEADGSSETLTNIRFYCMNLDHFDAFSACGWFAHSIQISMEGRIKSLKILQTLLKLTEKHGLIEKLSIFISKVGLRWTGVDWRELWREKDVREQFNAIFDFLLKHKNVLGEALKYKIMDVESRWLFANASRYNSFALLQRLLDLTLTERDFKLLLIPSSNDERFHGNGNLVIAWTRVILFGSVMKVVQVWSYLESKLKTRVKRKKFLRRKDYEGRNAIIAAFIRRKNDDVIPFVSQVIEREFSQGEWKEFMRESLLGEHFDPVTSQTKEDFKKSVNEVFQMGFQSLEVAFQHLRSKEKYIVPIGCNIPIEFTISGILKIQQQLTVARQHECARGEMKDSLKRTAGYLKWLSSKCLFNLDELESSVVHGIRKEFNKLLPALSLCLPAVNIPLDVEGCLVGVLDKWERRVKGDCLIAYFVLLWRRLEQESKYFTARELIDRILRELNGIYQRFPTLKFTAKTGSIWMSKSLLIHYFFAVLSAFLQKEELSEVLLHVEYAYHHWNVFHYALDANDLMAFLTLYDLARLCMGEDAVWKVHAILRFNKSILEVLLSEQDKGSFEKPIPTIQDVLVCYSSEKVFDLQLYSQCKEWVRNE